MPENKDVVSTTSNAKLFEANMTLAFYKSAAVIPTQPIQVIMRNQQAALADKENPRILNAFEAVRKIAGTGTASGSGLFSRVVPFYRGAIPSLSKEFLKNAVYKGALIAGAPGLADRLLAATHLSTLPPPSLYGSMQTIVAGGIAAAADVGIGGALEAWATNSATSDGKNANYLKNLREAALRDKLNVAYKGWRTALAKNFVAFTAYFGSKEAINARVAQAYGYEDVKNAPWYVKLTSAVSSGGAVALASAPLDVAKTQAQMPDADGRSTFNLLRHNIGKYGLKGATAGLPLKFFMVGMGWAITDLGLQQVFNKPGNR